MSSASAVAAVISTLSAERPFPGLRPFEELDSNWFFGRSSEINELLKRLRRVRFVAIVGPSGCGKSSLIKAGVLPPVRDGYLDSSWSIAAFRPGEQPLDNLAKAVSSAISGHSSEIRKLLDSGSLGLVKAVELRRLPPDNKLLVLVDQFEELFQFAQRHGEQSQEEVKAFLKLLLTAAASDDVPVYVVITMRMEWLSECATYVGLAEAINEGIYLVPQMSRRQFQQVILNPIERAGGTITSSVLDRMLNDLGGRTDQLPVLQHALMRLWGRRRPGEPLDMADYDAVGTFSNCLSNHAEEIYGELNDEQKGVAERLFRSITQVFKNRKIRRPRPFGELLGIPGVNEAALRTVIEAFGKQGRSFLFITEGAIGPSSVIDISHEALMRQWDRLAGWVEDEADIESRLSRLQEDAAEWDKSGRKDRSALYMGYKLRRAEELRPRLAESKVALDFLNASRRARRSLAGYVGTIAIVVVAVLVTYAYVRARDIVRYRREVAVRAATAQAQKQADAAQQTAEEAVQQTRRDQLLQKKIREELAAAKSSQALAAVAQTIDSKRIYMQYVAQPTSSLSAQPDAEYQLAKDVGAKLKGKGYTVPGYEKVAADRSPSKTQVRYFYKTQDEQNEAENIAALLRQWVKGDVSTQLTANPKGIVPAGQFEVWLAAGTTAAPAQ